MNRAVQDSKRLTVNTQAWLHWHMNNEAPEQTIKQAAYALSRLRRSGDNDSGLQAKRIGKRVTDDIASDVVHRLILSPVRCRSFVEWLRLPHKQLRLRLLEPYQPTIKQAIKQFNNLFPNSTTRNRARAYFVESYPFYSYRDKTSFHPLLREGMAFVKRWLLYKRARDFFVKGLGTFDFATTTRHFDYDEWRHPLDLTACGYLERELVHAHLEMVDLSMRRHFGWILKNYQQWTVQHFQQVIEIAEAGELDELYAHLKTAKTRYRYYYRINECPGPYPDNMTPREFMAAWAAWHAEYYPGHGNTVEADEAIPVDYKYPTHYKPKQIQRACSSDHYTVSPVKTYGELVQAGVALHNCAASYHDELVEGRISMFTLCNGDDKPIALGSWDTRMLKWEQIRETCNKAPSKEVQNAFKQYIPENGMRQCPICGEWITARKGRYIDPNDPRSGFLIGSCGDSFTPEQWEAE